MNIPDVPIETIYIAVDTILAFAAKLIIELFSSLIFLNPIKERIVGTEYTSTRIGFVPRFPLNNENNWNH